MKRQQEIILIISLITVFILGIYIGRETTKQEYLNRALELPQKKNYTARDIEHILFNESQEQSC